MSYSARYMALLHRSAGLRYGCARRFAVAATHEVVNEIPVPVTHVKPHPGLPKESALPQPPPTGGEKQYSEKIKNIVDSIAGLSLLEASDLNELLKKRLNLPDTPMMAAGMMMAAPAASKEDEPAQEAIAEKSTFTLKLIKFDDTKKINLIKEIKNIVPGLNLVQAKKFVESLPQVVKADGMKADCQKLKEAIEAQGGICVIE